MHFDKYEKFGDYHWDEFKKPTIYRHHVLKVLDWIKEKDILDIGCGDGLITSLLNAEGIDNHEIAIGMARHHGVKAKIGSVYNLNEERKYEVVFLGDILEHLDYPNKAIDEIGKITNILYIATPPKEREPRPYHVKEFSPEELKDFMENLGWTQESSEVANVRIYAKFTKNNLIG